MGLQEITYEFGFGEDLTHFVLRADRVSDAEDRPGLYAWYLRPPGTAASEEACTPYRRVFADRRFTVSATAPLGERMRGTVDRHQAKLKAPVPGEDLHEALFVTAFAAFSPPVYIGRSKTIRSRLCTHVRNLEAELARPGDEASAATPATADTDDESAHFGTRMGALLRTQGLTDYRGLFVKLVYADSNAATKRVEYLLNRTFHPVLGRL